MNAEKNHTSARKCKQQYTNATAGKCYDVRQTSDRKGKLCNTKTHAY